MRLTPRRALGLIAAVAIVFTIPLPTHARSAGAIAGSCDLVGISVQPDAHSGKTTVATTGSGLCVVTEYNGVNPVGNAAQIAGFHITSSSVELLCSGSAVRGFTGNVTVRVDGADDDVFHVSMLLDAAPGSQTANPTATALIDGTRFAGTGTFTRNGSGNCAARTASWSLGHITFEDPTL